MKRYTITHAAHGAHTGRPIHDMDVIEVPFSERHAHAGYAYRCGYIAPDGAHVAVCEKPTPPSPERCPRCRG